MKKLIVKFVLPTVLAIGVLIGCGTSPPPRLYLIEPMSAIADVGAGSGPTIAIAPVLLPKRLDRKEIVTHDEPFRVNAAEFDRWAEPLEDGISAALAENLSILVPTDYVVAYPWGGTPQIDYKVHVRVITFGADPGGEVVLRVSWLISDAANAPLAASTGRYEEQRRGDNMVDTVAAMSRAIEQLSREIATAIKVESDN